MVDENPNDGWFSIRAHYKAQIKELSKQLQSLPKRDPRRNTLYHSINEVRKLLIDLPGTHADALPQQYGDW